VRRSSYLTLVLYPAAADFLIECLPHFPRSYAGNAGSKREEARAIQAPPEMNPVISIRTVAEAVRCNRVFLRRRRTTADEREDTLLGLQGEFW